MARRGLLYIVSSPSGAGKTTLARRLLAADPNIAMSVSVTTRPSRPGERDGVDYHFVDRDRFEIMKDRGDLLEWARVFDNQYGTPRAPVEAAILAGEDVLFDIDWQGAQQLSEKMPGDVVRVFVLPPSGPVLEERLKARAQEFAGNRRAAHGGGIRRNQPLARLRLRDRQQRSRNKRKLGAGDPYRRAPQTCPPSWPFGVRARYAGGALSSRLIAAIDDARQPRKFCNRQLFSPSLWRYSRF